MSNLHLELKKKYMNILKNISIKNEGRNITLNEFQNKFMEKINNSPEPNLDKSDYKYLKNMILADYLTKDLKLKKEEIGIIINKINIEETDNLLNFRKKFLKYCENKKIPIPDLNKSKYIKNMLINIYYEKSKNKILNRFTSKLLVEEISMEVFSRHKFK